MSWLHPKFEFQFYHFYVALAFCLLAAAIVIALNGGYWTAVVSAAGALLALFQWRIEKASTAPLRRSPEPQRDDTENER